MKRTTAALFAIILVGIMIYGICLANKKSNTDGGRISNVIHSTQNPESTGESTVQTYENWNLILVNDSHGIPKNYCPELTLLNNGKSVDSRIYPNLQTMFNDMRSDGIYPIVGEGYRTVEEQAQMMNDYIAMYMNDGYSENEAKRLAEKYVAKVGHSEHQLGLAVDINADSERSSDDEVYAWLAENAYKYGFILRYPANKTSITGIDFEPWHYRYVGKEAALEIFEQGICLEEYVK